MPKKKILTNVSAKRLLPSHMMKRLPSMYAKNSLSHTGGYPLTHSHLTGLKSSRVRTDKLLKNRIHPLGELCSSHGLRKSYVFY